jgi:hypothetical protein
MRQAGGLTESQIRLTFCQGLPAIQTVEKNREDLEEMLYGKMFRFCVACVGAPLCGAASLRAADGKTPPLNGRVPAPKALSRPPHAKMPAEGRPCREACWNIKNL